MSESETSLKVLLSGVNYYLQLPYSATAPLRSILLRTGRENWLNCIFCLHCQAEFLFRLKIDEPKIIATQVDSSLL
jgi:hypothetical protein